MALAPSDFVHLHVHSEYSLLDGANRIEPLLDHVKNTLGQPAVALTDHGVLYGALQFYNAARARGVKPLLGCEVYITANSRFARGGGEKANTHHLLLLAETLEGYRNLCRLSSIGHTEGYYYKPRIDFETLEQHKAGLIATTSCLSGLVPTALLDGNVARAREYVGKFVDIFGRERYFVEIQDHGLREQRITNAGLLEIARTENLRIVATNDCHYLRREDAELHDVLLCVQTGSRLTDEKRMRFSQDQFYVKSTEEMAALFGDMPEALTNTRLVAEMCNVEMPEKRYHLPRFPCPEGKTEDETLSEKVWEGARRRYGARLEKDAELRERIQFELDTIQRMGFPAYFLIVADFIDYARSQDIPVGPGRGSAAGSVVAYCLRIVELDPIEHGLLFERFLNPDRISMPDIDIDFCFERRGEVIDYVRRKYGEDCVSHIITFGTMKSKAALKDVGRVMEIPLKEVERLTKAIPEDLKMTLAKARQDSPEVQQLIAADPQIAKMYAMAERVEGMVRHASIHAAGIIISDKPISEYCPLYKAPNEDRPATQFTMNECESDLGLLKMDFLGIKNLTIIHRVEKWLKERDGVDIDWDAIPTSDPKTYEILHKGYTLGVFQLESEGMTALVKRLRPTEFADLTALLALYRPGPLGANMHDMYVRRKHGEEKVVYDHPALEPFLRETYGVVLYQEQVMRIAMDMCGFTRGEADQLRKAMSKKQQDVMDKMKVKFVDGAVATRQVPKKLATKIWNDIVSFASYGFNKSHSAAYAIVTFRTAYLRAHYPTYFMAALLTNEIDSSDKNENMAKYIAHCREIGIALKPVDINRSRDYFNPDGEVIWFALNGIKGVGTGFARALVTERDANGPYKSLQDMCLRLPKPVLNSRALQALISLGAFDALHPHMRRGLEAALDAILSLAGDLHRSLDDDSEDLFADAGLEAPAIRDIPIPNLPPLDERERANAEKQFLGFFLSEHPLLRHELELRSFVTAEASEIDALAKGLGNKRVPVRLMGSIADIMRRTDKNNRPWAIVTLEDLSGRIDIKLFAQSYTNNAEMLELDAIVGVDGVLSVWNERASVEVRRILTPDQIREEATALEVIWPITEVTQQAVYELAEVTRRHSGSRPVRITLALDDNLEARFQPNGQTRISLTPGALEAVKALPGAPRVRLVLNPPAAPTYRS